MKINGKQFLPPFKPIDFIDSSLGRLAVFPISYGDHVKVFGEPPHSIQEMLPSELATRLIPYIVHIEESLGEGKIKPAAPTLSPEQVAALSDAEIEAILAVHIRDQRHLYCRFESTTTTDAEGKSVVSSDYGEIEHPKEQGETNAQYLKRLYILQEQRLKEDGERFCGSMLGFSEPIRKSIASTLTMGDSLGKAMEGLRSRISRGIDVAAATAMPKIPEVDWQSIAHDAEESRWAPFNSLADRLDQLVRLGTASSEFMVRMNETQTGIAGEIKSSGDSAARIGRDSLKVTRLGFYVTIAVFALTVVGLVLPEVNHRSSSNGSAEFRKQLEQWASSVRDLGTNMTIDRKTASAELNTIVAKMDQTRTAQEKQIQAILNQQGELIRHQAQDRVDDRQVIDDLRRKVSELELIAGNRQSQTRPSAGGK
ncbi:MAG: hypothetical protein WCK05_04605 [Planctomycetota bacterium]